MQGSLGSWNTPLPHTHTHRTTCTKISCLLYNLLQLGVLFNSKWSGVLFQWTPSFLPSIIAILTTPALNPLPEELLLCLYIRTVIQNVLPLLDCCHSVIVCKSVSNEEKVCWSGFPEKLINKPSGKATCKSHTTLAELTLQISRSAPVYTVF